MFSVTAQMWIRGSKSHLGMDICPVFFHVGRGFVMMGGPLFKDVSDIHRQDLKIQKIGGPELNQLIVPHI